MLSANKSLQELKTGGFVEVKQDHAYADILVIETTKMKEACEADQAYICR